MEGMDGRLTCVNDLVDIAGQLPASRVAVAGGDRVEDLRLVESARDHGIIDRIILVGDGERIARAVDELGIEIPQENIRPGKDAYETASITADLVRNREVDIVLKGNISTPIVNRKMIPLAIRPTVSLVSIFDAAPIANGRPLILTDAGVTTICNFGRMVDLIHNAVDVAQVVMKIPRPKVAILSANEKQIPSLASTRMGAELSQRDWPNAVVYGPLSFDLATDPDSVAIKGLPDLPAAQEVGGQADILVCPSIDAANVLYKTVTAMVKYGQASLACITAGFPVPYIILSRADSLSTRLESIALCSIYVQRTRTVQEPKKVSTAEAKTDLSGILVINPGSTSMKVSLYKGHSPIEDAEIACDIPVDKTPGDSEAVLTGLCDQVLHLLEEWKPERLDAIACRGGFLPRDKKKISGGTYLVAEKTDRGIVVEGDIVRGVSETPEMAHASNWSIPMGAKLAEKLEVPAFTVDPVVVDEFREEAEISGLAGITRKSTAHALSIRAAAHRAATEIGRPIEDISVVVAHLGGGITVAAVQKGRIVDNNIALLGGGPFTPQRVGNLPLSEIIDLCYDDSRSKDDVKRLLTKAGGLRSYLKEDKMEVLEKRIEDGDEEARKIVEAMIYQIAKEAGSMFVAAGGDVEAVVLTGGLARSKFIVKGLRKHLGRFAPVMIFPGSLEMEALASGVLEILSGEKKPRRYALPATHRDTGGANHE